MDPNRDSHQAQTGRISFEDWMRLTAACATRPEAGRPVQATQDERRLATPLLPILATLFLAAAAVIAILLWQ